jgi:hypothetical protein
VEESLKTKVQGYAWATYPGMTLKIVTGQRIKPAFAPKTIHYPKFHDASPFSINAMIPSRPGSSLGERRQSISSNGAGRASLGASGRSSIGASGRTSIGGGTRASTGIGSSGIPRPQSRVSFIQVSCVLERPGGELCC